MIFIDNLEKEKGDHSMNYRCAGIVTYQPNISRLKNNIDALVEQVDMIIIIDNGSSNQNELRNILGSYIKVSVIFNTSNIGIASALNQICTIARENRYDWCLLMDQDSICSDNLIKEYSNYINDNDIAILAPYIVDEFKITLNQYKKLKLPEKSLCAYAITSGSFINIKIWNDLDGFIDNMFIDGVDSEYSYRVREQGYKIYRINSCYILHQQGNKTEKTHIYRIYRDLAGNMSIKPAFRFNYSKVRWYYMARNNLAIIRKYRGLNGSFIPLMSYILRFLSVIIIERDKKMVSNAIFKGIKDGLHYSFPETKNYRS